MHIGIQGAVSWRLRIIGTFLSILTSFPLSIMIAQVSTSITSVSPSDAVSETPLSIRAELQNGESVERVYFVYRPFGESEWTHKEMDLLGNTATVKIPADDVRSPFVEFYFVLALRSGAREAYPLSDSPDPFSTPPSKTLQLPVVNKEDDVQAVFLSPDQSESFAPSDVLISVSLLRADSIVVRRATQILLDGADVTQYAVRSDDMLVYVPDNHGVLLKPGRHRVTVRLYNRQGNLHRQVSASFYVLEDGVQKAHEQQPFRYAGTLDLELRHEKVSNAGTWYNRGGLRFTGSQGDWRFNANAFLTSEEDRNRQPQNRYYAALESHWLLAGYGDSYPNFPNLILNGKRVRGLNSSLRLGKFNIDLTLGKTVREVEGALLKTIRLADLGSEQQSDPYAAYARIDSQTWGKYSYGTYARDIFAVRPSFGSGETYQIGFTWLKSKDDARSIRFGTRPQENLVLGTDMISKFDNNRIELTAQGAFSAYNSDISSGNFTDAYIDSVYKKDAATIKDARDILKNFITVNDNLRPLSFKKLSTFAYDVGVMLNYFNNTFKASYLYRGSDYNSFGQTFLRRDIAGFSLLDRLRLAGQNIFLTLGYERLHDNTSSSKGATTRFTTMNVAVSYDPRNGLPSFNAGYSHYANANDLLQQGADSISVVDDQTNRYYFLVAHHFSLAASHTGSVSVSISNRDDYTMRNLDVKNVAVSFNLTTKYALPLQTQVGYTINTNKFPSPVLARTTEQLDYSTVFVSGQYFVPEELGSVSVTVSPTFGDFKRLTLDGSALWNVAQAMSFILQYSYFQNDGMPNDDFWSLKYRYEF